MTFDKQLRLALMDAFPTEGKFEMMLKDELNKDYKKIATGENYEQKVFNLINDFQAENKIKELINAAQKANPGNPELLNFIRDYLNPITYDELSNLKSLLSEIDFQLVKKAYLKTLPDGSTIDNIKISIPTDTDNIIRILFEDYPKTSSSIPSIVEFAHRLANQELGIRTWVRQLTAKLNIQLPDISEEEYDESEQLQSYLLIIVYPEGNNFRLEAEFILDERQKPKPEPLDLKEILNLGKEDNDRKGIVCDSFEKISEQLGSIIPAFISKYLLDFNAFDLTIEIFLPYKYLSQNIDHMWQIKHEVYERAPVVIEYNLIVHPLERMMGINSFKNLKNGWKTLRDTLDKNPSQDILMKEIQPISQIDSRNWKKLADDLKKKIGLKLNSPLSNDSKDQDIFFKTILGGGVPIAFWTRYETPPCLKLEEQIDCYLTVDCLNNNLQKLIEGIWQIRKDAYVQENPQDYLGYHLGFLCDNPNRIPRIKPLQ